MDVAAWLRTSELDVSRTRPVELAGMRACTLRAAPNAVM